MSLSPDSGQRRYWTSSTRESQSRTAACIRQRLSLVPDLPTVMAENDLIQKIGKAFGPSGTSPSSLALGMGDDAALWRPNRATETILTCDWFLEGTHFLRAKHPPDSVGWKCLARAVSDVAAMGGTPQCFLLSLALPHELGGRWLDEFLRGLRRASVKLGCRLAGGDTTRSTRVLISVTVIGEVKSGKAVLRSGARPGDLIFTSGRLGEAELGLRLLRNSQKQLNLKNLLLKNRLKKQLYPEPRVALGRWLAQNRLASAMMDLSDGLSTDLPRLCSANRVGARIFAARVPSVQPESVPKNLRADLRKLALHGGEDYELLFTASPKEVTRIPRVFGGVPITAIGEITRSRDILLVDENGRERPLPNQGWDPFRE